MNVFDMNQKEFKQALSERTTPEQVFQHAGCIYDYLDAIFNMTFMDSLLREWAFQWYSEQTGNSYDNIYNKWLEKA